MNLTIMLVARAKWIYARIRIAMRRNGQNGHG